MYLLLEGRKSTKSINLKAKLVLVERIQNIFKDKPFISPTKSHDMVPPIEDSSRATQKKARDPTLDRLIDLEKEVDDSESQWGPHLRLLGPSPQLSLGSGPSAAQGTSTAPSTSDPVLTQKLAILFRTSCMERWGSAKNTLAGLLLEALKRYYRYYSLIMEHHVRDQTFGTYALNYLNLHTLALYHSDGNEGYPQLCQELTTEIDALRLIALNPLLVKLELGFRGVKLRAEFWHEVSRLDHLKELRLFGVIFPKYGANAFLMACNRLEIFDKYYRL
ncbi:hypothetical protein BGZ58_004696 [Dissophora ornata]|nr:hypothetical protein BGZ58_004696 [Dissophora ornata]